MEKLRALFAKPPIAALASFFIGVVIGLVVLGWWLWPVKWTDATPAELSREWQEEYLRLAIQAYGASGNAALAQKHFEALGANRNDILQAVIQNPQTLNPDLIASFGSATLAGGAPLPPTPTEGEEGGKAPSGIAPLLIAAICLVVAVIAVLGGGLLWRSRQVRARPSEPSPAQAAAEARRQVELTDYLAEGVEPPVAQFMASYKYGDDLFDDSFGIDSPSGEFLGECGVSICETIGVGEHKKVTAFEVWLFDKNDIQTVTKVLMSTHAFFDTALRQRLAPKGEPIQAEPNSEFYLETRTLTMVARIVDMAYGNSAMPAQSYFDHLLIELAIWQKPE